MVDCNNNQIKNNQSVISKDLTQSSIKIHVKPTLSVSKRSS